MAFPAGHYHSPIPSPDDMLRRQHELWASRETLVGVDMQVPSQLDLLERLRPYVAAINYPVEASTDPNQYYYQNGMFPVLDAEFLFGALCLLKPERVVEVGSGFSSLVMADVNRRILHGAMDITCIEPYPRDFLMVGVPGIARVVASRLEEADPALFEELQSGDVLFIDSSHVSKTGSDVNYLFFDLLPRLRPGVYVHLHDIFLPDEYPQSWVMDEQRSWNEQYLLHAFLMHNNAWRVVWMAYYMVSRHMPLITSVFPRCPSLGSGGSFWMQRC